MIPKYQYETGDGKKFETLGKAVGHILTKFRPRPGTHDHIWVGNRPLLHVYTNGATEDCHCE